MAELGSLGNNQAAATAGLAPVAGLTVQLNGKALSRGDRGNVQQALFISALAPNRFNPDLKPNISSSSQQESAQNRHQHSHPKAFNQRKCYHQDRPPLALVLHLIIPDTLNNAIFTTIIF